MNLFDKVEFVKKLASESVGTSEERILRPMLRRIGRKGVTKAKKYGVSRYSQQELILDQILKANEISPRTAYWSDVCILWRRLV